MKLAIDARMIRASGIGRYLRYVLDEVILLAPQSVRLLGNPDELREYAHAGWEIVPFLQGIYSPTQHVHFSRLLSGCDRLYVPHITIPLFGKPVTEIVSTIHDTFHLSSMAKLSRAERAYMKMIYRNALRKSDEVFVDSQSTADELGKHFPGRLLSRIRKTMCRFDPQYFSDLSSLPQSPTLSALLDSSRGKRLLYVGNVKPHKNLATLLRALEDHRLSDATLYIVGKRDGFLKGVSPEDQRRMERSGVVFAGSLSDSDLSRLYASVDLLVFPSLFEGFGYPPLEAFSLGTPVAASDLPVIREVCGELPVYFDPLSPGSIADAIVSALENENLREKIVASRERFFESLTAQKTSRAVAERICL